MILIYFDEKLSFGSTNGTSLLKTVLRFGLEYFLDMGILSLEYFLDVAI